MLLSYAVITKTFIFRSTRIALLYALLLSPVQASTTILPEAVKNTTPEYVVIQPSDVVTFSSETAASILNLNVREGSKFLKGDILLVLDCRLQKAELQKANAQYTATNLAQNSAEKLKKFGSISELELVKARADATIAKSEVDKFNAIVEKCMIKAPFNGAVSEIMVHPMESVKPGDPLLKIVNTENLEFEIQIPSKWLKWLKVGTTFQVKINETGNDVTAKVSRIDPQIESISQTIKITGMIEHPDSSLLPGMSGEAFFPDNPDQSYKART